MRRPIKTRNNLLLALPLAMAVMGHPTDAAASRQRTETSRKSSVEGPYTNRAVRDFLEERAVLAAESGRSAMTTATTMLDLVSEVAATSGATNQPLSKDAIRMWMESYNAGPYALLRYRGRVPYRETRNYTPKVMRYYAQDLSANPYDELIVKTARKYWLDPQLIRAIMKTESDFRPRITSGAGARGLMQVMPAVWREIRARYDLDWQYHRDVWEPERNIEVACAYLAWLRYDFLPRHFDEFDADPVAPPRMVREVASRATKPRIATRNATFTRLAGNLGRAAVAALEVQKPEPRQDRRVASHGGRVRRAMENL